MVLQSSFGNFTPHVIWVWPTYFAIMGYLPSLSTQAVLYSLQISFRIAPVLLSSLLLVMTSTPSTILRSLQKIGLPIPIVFSLIVAMRTIPRIFDAISLSINLQFMRGLGSTSHALVKPIYYIEAGLASFIPVIVYMLRGAKNTAISADTRAFRAFKTRTYLLPSTFGSDDVIMGMIVALIICSAVVAIYLGFGRSIPYAGF